MSRVEKREHQPWLKFIVLPILLIIFGLESSYVFLSRSRTETKATPSPIISKAPTPTPTPSVANPPLAGTPTPRFCGGIAAIKCPVGYKCVLDGDYPDAGGKCVSSGKFVCPKTAWVDCIPGPGSAKTQCSTDFLNWAKENCKDFQGAAL